ncbi:lipase member K-like, partial [Asbolus verrucosus]
HIGSFEAHEVITEDGYILGLFRIPRINPKGVILLQHPVTVDSKIWLSEYKNSTAFIFWRAGYDVWLGNNRGTLYSKKHVNLTHTDPEFWDYSFHEMGVYDHHASIQYIKQHVNTSRIIFLGHSMATTSSLIYAAMRSEDAANSLKVIVNMAPVSYMKYLKTPATIFNKLIEWNSILSHNAWYLKLGRLLFQNIPVKKWLIYIISFFCGWTPEQYDPQFINLMVAQFGSEVSWKVYYHYAQIFNSGGKFQMYDYAKNRNLKLYGTESPPLYPINKIKTPIYLFYSAQDIISQPEDVEFLYDKLPKEAKIYGKVKFEGFNHIDYHYSKNRIKEVYDKILKFLHNI